jgi:hypothetical protein
MVHEMNYYIVYPNNPKYKGADKFVGVEKGLYGFCFSGQDTAHPFASREEAEGFLTAHPQFRECDYWHLPAKVMRGELILRLYEI